MVSPEEDDQNSPQQEHGDQVLRFVRRKCVVFHNIDTHTTPTLFSNDRSETVQVS
jgi:hypothetical protein